MRTMLLLGLFLALVGCAHGPRHGGGMRHMDTNGDGAVSKAEWSGQFDAIDKNKDGSITKDEMKSHHKGHKASCKKCAGGKEGHQCDNPKQCKHKHGDAAAGHADCKCPDCQDGKHCKNCKEGKACGCDHAKGGDGKCADCDK